MNDNINSNDFYLLNIEIAKLNRKIDDLTIQIDDSNKIVVNHINFIESVYNYIRRPLFFMVNKINNIFLLNDK
jgi:hypothetical protein